MNSSPTPAPERLPDAVAARVLERAAQLDIVAARSVSLADLRAAALGAGISEAALDQALEEVAAGTLAAPAAPVKPPRRSVLPLAALLVAGAAILTAAYAAARQVIPPPFTGGVVIEVATPRAPAPPAPPAPPPPPGMRRDREIVARPR